MPAALQFLKEQAADIVLLQEVNNGTDPSFTENLRAFEVLKERLDYPYADFAPAVINRLEAGKIQEGNAVLSRFPILGHDVHFLSGELSEHPYDPALAPAWPRNLQHVALDANGSEINVFNFQGVWDLDGDNFSEQRRRMSDTIIEQVKNKPHVILAGDTNAKPTNPAMRAIEEHLTSVFGNSLTTTFNMQRKDNPGYATAAVDLMYVSNDLRVTGKTCLDVDISDHLPLVVTLETTNPTKEKE
jgi:endonuclease/exonuclease/phosphatase family metal-dependent hydrolase